MDENQPSPIPEVGAQPAASLTSRLTNVFVSPGEVFDEVKRGPTITANWIAPMVLVAIAGIIYSLVVFSQQAVLQKLRDPQQKAMQKRVEQGKMTQQQADQALQVTENFMTPTVMKVLGILGSVFGTPAGLFFNALILWLLGRFAFRSDATYWQFMEVTCLASMITVLGSIIAMLLAVIYGDLAMTLGPALLVKNFDATNKVHATLGALNLIMLWHLAVLSLGLSKVSGTQFWKAAVWLFGLFYGLWATFAIGLPLLLARILPQ